MITVLILIYLVSASHQNAIQTVQGKIRGVQNDGFVSYHGIPYGTAREADVKFKQAGLAPSWAGIRESLKTVCTPWVVEECLKLDVHVPTSGGAPWPVLVWITGGGGPYHPGRLVKQGIIFVTVHHRFGALGFLCTKEERIPGNAGAKDVVSALRWVRDNIVAFKGNPANVVVAGQGFGAAVVEGLMLSPMAEGLFQGAIMQSGTILSPWVFNYDATQRALRLGQMYTDSDAVASSLIKADNNDLADKTDKLNVPYFPFGMCVEKPHKNQERFLPEPPFDMLSNNKVRRVPLMIGFNSDEGYIFAEVLNRVKILRKIANDMNILLPEELKYLNEREKNKIKELYYDGRVNMSDVLVYHRDVYFMNHVHRSARLHAASSDQPVYYYQFSHAGPSGVEAELPKTGAAHSDELALMFPEKGEELEGGEGAVQATLIRLWTNFVKHLRPTSPSEPFQWAAMEPHRPRFLDIDGEPAMRDFPYERASRLWDDLYEKHYYNKLRNNV